MMTKTYFISCVSTTGQTASDIKEFQETSPFVAYTRMVDSVAEGLNVDPFTITVIQFNRVD